MTRTSHRVDAIDALRAIAMLAVVAQHCAILPFGWAGVWLFYVISGYVITRAIEGRRDEHLGFGQRYATFMALRAARIVPALAAYLGACAIVAGLTASPHFVEHLPYLLGFVFNWRMITLDYATSGLWGPIGHLWTISVEQQFYLLFPLLAMAMPGRHRVKACLVLIALGPVVRAATSAGMPSDASALYKAYAIYASTHGHVDAFVMGALIAYRESWLAAKPHRTRALLLAAGALLTVYVAAYAAVNHAQGARGVDTIRDVVSGILYGQGREVWVYTALTAVFAAFVALAATGRLRLPAPLMPPLAWMGRVSYSAYLVHALVIWLFNRTLFDVARASELDIAGRVVLFACVTAVTLGVSQLMYRFVETPCNAWMKRRLAGRTPVARDVPARQSP